MKYALSILNCQDIHAGFLVKTFDRCGRTTVVSTANASLAPMSLDDDDITLRQHMSTIVKMLMAKHGLTPRSLLAQVPMMSNPSFYKRLNANKDWEAGELAKLAKFFDVPVSTFFKDPDEVFPPSDPNRGRARAGSVTRQKRAVVTELLALSARRAA